MLKQNTTAGLSTRFIKTNRVKYSSFLLWDIEINDNAMMYVEN